jgi:hypothetical protein
MRWEYSALIDLRREFNDEVFRVEDAYNVLNSSKGYVKGTVYRVLHDLVIEGLIVRLGRGIYQIPKDIKINNSVDLSASFVVRNTLDSLKKVKEVLNEKGIEYMITGESILYQYHHYLSRRLLHLVYVIKGSGEYAVTSLSNSGMRAILNPSYKEIIIILKNFNEQEFFVIREYSFLYGNINGSANIERALIDLYFESTRRKIPYPVEEVGRVFSKVFRSEKINISSLFMLADKRGIKNEIQYIVNYIKPDFPIMLTNHIKKLVYVNMIINAIEHEGIR